MSNGTDRRAGRTEETSNVRQAILPGARHLLVFSSDTWPPRGDVTAAGWWRGAENLNCETALQAHLWALPHTRSLRWNMSMTRIRLARARRATRIPDRSRAQPARSRRWSTVVAWTLVVINPVREVRVKTRLREFAIKFKEQVDLMRASVKNLISFSLSGRSAIEHVHHNHTYHLPAESSGSLQRPITRDKKGKFLYICFDNYRSTALKRKIY